MKLGDAAGLDPEQTRDLRNDLQEQGYPLMVIANTLSYNRDNIRMMMAPVEIKSGNHGGGIGRVHGFMRGACARQLEWLLADLIEMGHS